MRYENKKIVTDSGKLALRKR